MKTICFITPRLDGSNGNPMVHCTKPVGHGKDVPHSWEPKTASLQLDGTWMTDTLRSPIVRDFTEWAKLIVDLVVDTPVAGRTHVVELTLHQIFPPSIYTNICIFKEPRMESPASTELPRYRCHKEVHALKIADIQQGARDASSLGGSWLLIPEDKNFSAIEVPHAWYVKHEPKAGGYLVVYEGGYRSWSPAEAFDDGYALLSKIPPPGRPPIHGASLLEKLDDIFTYHAPEGDMPVRYAAIRDAGKALAEMIVLNTPACADQTAAVRKVREAVMTANAAIALKGLV